MNAIKMFACVAAALLGLSHASGASAATQIVNGSGQLIGATGVMINGQAYDVSFVDGSCTQLYGGCNPAAFDFDQSGAFAAAQALLGQVFQDTSAGAFSSLPGLTFGCGTAPTCAALIPFSFDDFGSLNVYGALNTEDPAFDRVFLGQTTANVNYTGNDNGMYARFTRASVAAVPEPSTWAMMILGFGVVGVALRGGARRRRAVA